MSSGRIWVGALCVLAASATASSLAAFPREKGAVVETVSPDARVDFEIVLPLRDRAGLERLVEAQQTPGAAQYHAWLTPDQFAARFGSTPDVMARAQAAARAAGLQVTQARSRSFHVAGDAAHVNAMLGAALTRVTAPSGARRLVAPGKRLRPAMAPPLRAIPDNRYGAAGAYWFDDIKQAYDAPAYPATASRTQDGSGVRVAVLMADLAYPVDIQTLFEHEQFTAITGKPAPTFSTVLVDGGGVLGGYGSAEADGDIRGILGQAPGAGVTVVSLPDLSISSIFDGYVYIIDANTYDVVDFSTGGCELAYTK